MDPIRMKIILKGDEQGLYNQDENCRESCCVLPVLFNVNIK